MITTEDKIRFVLQFSHPDGDTAKQLLRLLDKVKQRTFLSPQSEQFIEDSYRELVENVECRSLTNRGGCREQVGRPCEHKALFRLCPMYTRARPERASRYL